MTFPSAEQPPSPDAQPSFRRRAVLFAVAMSPFLAFLALLVWSQTSAGNPGGLLEHNEPGDVPVTVRAAPEFSGVDVVTGEQVDLASLRGKTLVVGFWSSWCVACRVEAADLASVYLEYAAEPVEFVGLAIWDAAEDVSRHIERFDVAYPNLIDENGSAAVAYGVRGVPEKFFVDKEGRIVRKIIGPMSAEGLRAVLDSMLAE